MVESLQRVQSAISAEVHRSSMPKGLVNGHGTNWKGGKSIASNGYVLVFVGKDHLLADVRGYAYEHRLIAQRKIGRPLRTGEHVHHIDGNKQNNHPENLEVLTAWEHRVEHRDHDSVSRLPGEPNPILPCACGCGERFPKYDSLNRPRYYVSGHNRPNTPTISTILSILQDGQTTRAEIVRLSDMSITAIAACLSKLKKTGLIDNDGRGNWGLAGQVKKRTNEEILCACGCGTKLLRYDDSWRERRFISGHNARRS